MRRLAFIILLLLLPVGVVGAQGSLEYGESVTGIISNDAPTQTWTFEGQAGDLLSITMLATNYGEGLLDCYLIVQDAAGNTIAENDDGPDFTTLDSEITGLVLPADGTYTILATRFGQAEGNSTGDYELTLTLQSRDNPIPSETATPAAPSPTPDASPDFTPMPPPTEDGAAQSETYTGSITQAAFAQEYRFQASADRYVTIEMNATSGDLDSLLRLLDSNGEVLASNDDADLSTFDAAIVDFRLPADGEYIVLATRYAEAEGSTSGDYELHITLSDSPSSPTEQPEQEEASPTASPPAPDAAGLLEYGMTVQGALSTNASAEYAFNGQAGDVVTVSVKQAQGSSLNPALELLDASGMVLAANDRFNGEADARIEAFTLPADGVYSIRVIGEGDSEGGYVLYLFTPESSSVSPPDGPPHVSTQASPPPPPATPDVEAISNASLVISLSWQGSSDFDLTVTDPSGNVLDFVNPQSDSGGTFGGDMHGGCQNQVLVPNEVAYWEAPPPSGVYHIDIFYVLPCGDRGNHRVTVTVTLNGEVVEVFQEELSEGQHLSLEWTME